MRFSSPVRAFFDFGHKAAADSFLFFLNQLEKKVPPDLELHSIHYSTHKGAEVERWRKSKKRRRFHSHFTPTSSSWLNQVEGWFGLIAERMTRSY